MDESEVYERLYHCRNSNSQLFFAETTGQYSARTNYQFGSFIETVTFKL